MALDIAHIPYCNLIMVILTAKMGVCVANLGLQLYSEILYVCSEVSSIWVNRICTLESVHRTVTFGQQRSPCLQMV